MNVEPITQSEVSHQEKYKYCILTHTYGILRDGTDEFIFSTVMENQTENRAMVMGGREEREGEMYVENNIEIYSIICKIDSQWKFPV